MPDFTLSLTATQAQRVAVAFGRYWQLKDAQGQARDATAAEVKTYLIRQFKGVVTNAERAEAEAAISAPAELVVT